MALTAVGLVLASCCLHAVWNLLLKQSGDKLAFTALYLASGVALYLPLFLWMLPSAHIPPAGWLCIGGTGLAYFGYFVGIAAAYRGGDLSLAYPLMRGLGPALAFVGGVATMGERPTALGATGVAVILLTALALQRTSGRERIGGLTRSATVAAVFVGVMYGAYSLIDKVGVGTLRIPPPVYIYLTYSVSALLVGTYALRTRGRACLAAEWRAHGRACVTVGAFNVLAYLLVLYAMALPHAPVSYIVPLRTTSVTLGIVLGAVLLRERHLGTRLALGGCMMLGIALIAWKG